MQVLDPPNEFACSLAKVLVHEGGFFQSPSTPRRRDDEGVTQRVYDEYRRTLSLSVIP